MWTKGYNLCHTVLAIFFYHIINNFLSSFKAEVHINIGPYNFVDTIAKAIPNELGITIDKALLMNPELRGMYESDESVKKLIDMSRRLEGLPRHTSMHAAGVCNQPETNG